MAITGVAAGRPQGLAQLGYVDAYLPIEVENEITPWSTPIEAMERISYHVKLTVS